MANIRFNKTRLAPSPTGALHLGNARTFLATWLLARQANARITLRIEDLDGPRIKPDSAAQTLQDLQWLGLNWDEGPIQQSTHMPAYQQAINQLFANGSAYYCVCSRKDIDQAASAPHTADGAFVYPGTCRGRFVTTEQALSESGRHPAIRFAVPPGTIEVNDSIAGRNTTNVARDLGDFGIAKADGTPAYQLAVVVDDAAADVDMVIRGDDLLDSTPRQILLYKALGLTHKIPQYAHMPLMVGPDGRRLAKRHGDTRLATLREHGVTPHAVVGYLAEALGCHAKGLTSPHDVIDLWHVTDIPPSPWVVGPHIEQELQARH